MYVYKGSANFDMGKASLFVRLKLAWYILIGAPCHLSAITFTTPD